MPKHGNTHTHAHANAQTSKQCNPQFKLVHIFPTGGVRVR